MPAVLTLNGQTLRYESDTITVGRAPGNQLSLPQDERLAPVHAVLKSVAGRWIVESRDGGPVRVGDGRPTRFAWLNPGDVIHLTEQGPQLVFEPSAAGENVPIAVAPSAAEFVHSAPQVSTPKSQPAQPMTGAASMPPAPVEASVRQVTIQLPRGQLFYLGVGGLVAALLVGLGILLAGRGPSAPVPDKQDRASRVDAPDERPMSHTPSPTPWTAGGKGSKDLTSDPRRALYRLELKTSDGKRAVQIGTAWAVGAQRLVTTGDAAHRIGDLQEDYPIAVVRPAVGSGEFEIMKVAFHPQYDAATRRFAEAVRDIERLKLELDQVSKPEDRQPLLSKLHAKDDAAVLALDEAMHVNVATLDVVQNLSTSLAWAESSIDPKIGQKLTMVGHPLPATDALVDPEAVIPPRERAGRLRHIVASPDASAPAHWLVGFDDPLKDQNWGGSPVLDSKGTVVGIYSRPTPPVPGAAPGAIVTHDITVIESLRALMAVRK